MRPAGKSRTSDGHESLSSFFLFFYLTRREIAGMQSCRRYLYVGLSVAAIQSHTRGNAAHVKRNQLRDIVEAARASEARSRAEKSVGV